MEKRILRERDLLTKIFTTLDETGNEKKLNDLIEYFLFVFSEEGIDIDHEDFSGKEGLWGEKRDTFSEEFSESIVITDNKELTLEYSLNQFCWKDKENEAENVSENISKRSLSSERDQNLAEIGFTGGAVTKILYEGIWSSRKASQNNFLFSQKGRFLGMLSISVEGLARFIFQIYKNRYIDTPTIVSNITFNISKKTQSTFEAETKTIINKENMLFRSEGQENCNLQVDLCLQNKRSKEPINISSDDVSNVQISGSILSPDCYIDLMFEGEVSLPEFVKALLFTLFQILFSALGIVPLYRMVTTDNSNQMLILSEWSFLFNIMLDFVLIVINLRFSMKILVEHFEFLTVITLFLMFSILFKVKFYIQAYDIRTINCVISQRHHSRRKFFFILKFTGFCLFFISCGTFFIEYEFLFYILFCYPLFQVWHNVTSVAQSNCFLWSVHPLLAFSQILYPIVMKGLRFSFFKLTPVPYFSYVLFAQLVFCMTIFILQKIFGATFFLPSFLIPNFYQYSRPFLKSSHLAFETCPICLDSLGKVHASPHQTASDKQLPLLAKEFYETPCGHRFHKTCLISWVEHKLICPCCRTNIPPIF